MNRNNGGFGRRGGQLMQAPSFGGTSTPAPYPVQGNAPQSTLTLASVLKAFGFAAAALLTLICVEAAMSGTTLITPINDRFLNVMRGIGFFLGIPLSVLIIIKPAYEIHATKKLLIFLFLPVLLGFAGGGFAWRVADWTGFAFSTEKFTPARYPIKYASHGRKGRRDSVEIDPFNLKDATDIAIPSAQFNAYWPNLSDYCITVMQRKSVSGAIQIKNDGVFMLHSPASATLTECPEAKAEQDRIKREYDERKAARRLRGG